jgi:cyclophilin family peptidyl-prolyl cis-trans isomerase
VQRYLWLLLVFVLALVPGCGANNPVVVMETSKGTIKIELFEDDAPITVKNFLRYVDEKHYDNTIFHRVIKDFMIQGGGITEDMTPKGGQNLPIKNESYNGLRNTRGTLAMARTDKVDSATDQFFINVVDNTRLDRQSGPGNEGYAVFGKVIEGMDVVDQIRNVRTGPNDVPTEPVIIKSIRRLNPK